MSDATPAAAKEQQRPSFWGKGAYEIFIESEGVPIHTGVAVVTARISLIDASTLRRP